MISAILEEDEALGAMLISWYMSGYHTGFYLVWVKLHLQISIVIASS